MVNVFLDTSAARSSLQSQRVRKRIQDLVKYEVLKLHIPEIVVMELVTGVSADAFPSASIHKELKMAIPWMGDGELATQTKATVALLRDLRKQGQTEVSQATRAWLSQVQAVVDPLSSHSAEDVFGHYFVGSGAFSAPKQRQDLPDGFILESLERLVRTVDSVIAIIGDKRLRKAAQKIGGVKTFESIHDALISEEIRAAESAALRRLGLKVRVEEISQALEFACAERRGDLESILLALLSEELEGMEIKTNLASDSGEATIVSAESVEITEFLLNKADIDPLSSSAQVPIRAEATAVTVDVFIFKGDYYALGDEEAAQYSIWDGDWNEHYVWAQAEIDIEIEATIDVLFEENDDVGGLELNSASVDSVDEVTQQELGI